MRARELQPVPDRIFSRPAFERARRVCLGLPGAAEKLAWGHPAFHVNGKTFCVFEMVKKRPSIGFRLTADEVSDIAEHGGFVTPYGRSLWVSLWMDQDIDWPHLTSLIKRSHTTIATKPASARVRASRGSTSKHPDR